MNVLSGIDYWLDNLICDVKELLMCYHLNGNVTNNNTVPTEDIPHLKEAKFSPQDIKNTAKNVTLYLRNNVTKIGHTYWLFKGKLSTSVFNIG